MSKLTQVIGQEKLEKIAYFGYFVAILTTLNGWFAEEVYSIFTSIVVLFISDRIHRRALEETTQEKIEEYFNSHSQKIWSFDQKLTDVMQKDFKDQFICSCFDTNKKAADAWISLMKSGELKSVKNTHFANIDKEEAEGAYTDKQWEEILFLIYKLLNTDNFESWTDIQISGTEDRVQALINWHQNLPPKARNTVHYKLKTINKKYSSLSTVNFIIFYFHGDRKAEVWFGWGYFKERERGPVFSSNNPQLVSYFARLFQRHDDIASDYKTVAETELSIENLKRSYE